MDPLRKPTEELLKADLVSRVEALEKQMQAKNTPAQPKPKDEPKPAAKPK